MNHLKILIYLEILVTSIFFSTSSFGNVVYIYYQNGKFIEAPVNDKLEETCDKGNFIFRESQKDEIEKYLKAAAKKAAFAGQMSPSLETLKASLIGSPGTCSWVSPDEFKTLK